MENEDVVIRARIDKKLKKAFENACKANDLTSSQVIRAFIREYLAKNGQKGLF